MDTSSSRGSKGQHAVRIGHYRLGRTLGKGSFGKVKIAEHEITAHQVAVKILNRQKIKNSKMDQKIRREIKILKLFRHPHIIRLYEVIETPTDIFMVMEFVSGGELFDYIVSKGRLSESEARHFFQQIVSGVEYCHRFMVVHRDLKPENLLLDSQNNVKIADFGLSNIMEDGTFLKTSCGSPNYAAPEVISGNLYAGPEVDVWSCGVILFALLCGRLPFDEDSIPSLFKKIKAGEYSMPSHLSSGARDLISKILVVDPLSRLSLAEIREHPWFRTDLPYYLSIPPSRIEEKNDELDMAVVDEVVKRMGIDQESAVAAIECTDINDVTVAYHLLLDQKQRVMLLDMRAEDELDAEKQFQLASSPPNPIALDFASGFHFSPRVSSPFSDPYSKPRSPGTSVSSERSFVGPESFSNPSTVNAMHAATTQSVAVRGEEEIPLRVGGTSTSFLDSSAHFESSDIALSFSDLWRLGFPTTLAQPMVVMQHIYQALSQHQCVWKILGPFHLKCKRSDPSQSRDLVFTVQLFRPNVKAYHQHSAAQEGHRRLHGLEEETRTPATSRMCDFTYCIDVRHVDGPFFTFLDFNTYLYSHFIHIR